MAYWELQYSFEKNIGQQLAQSSDPYEMRNKEGEYYTGSRFLPGESFQAELQG